MCHSLDVLNISVLGLESYTVVIRQNDKCTLSNNLTYFQQKCKSFFPFLLTIIRELEEEKADVA